MSRFWLLCLLAIFPLMAPSAQEAVPAGFEQWTVASLKLFDPKMHDDAVQDPHHFAVEQLADFPNDSFLWAHREGDGQVEWHETQADVFFVQSGSATLLLGGTMVNAETVGPHEKRNGLIRGGVRRKISAGDVIRIPPRIPHQILLEGSHEFDYFVVKIKGY
jgi:mannose-6-phosphate isomerase-like protein (cupin superfamily)